jgi:predicted transcriptional regulator
VAVPVARIDAYRKAGKAWKGVAIDEPVLKQLDEIATALGVTRNTVMADAIRDYVNHFPRIQQAKERAESIERSWMMQDVETLKAIQGARTDAEFAGQIGIAERTWVEIKHGRAISFAVLFDALRKHPELLDGRD